MEVIVWIALTVLWWVASLSVLLPLAIVIKFNRSLRNLWFSWFYNLALKICFERQSLPLRKQAFQILNRNLEKHNKSIPLKVLEIGIGTGANLEFYPENCHLTANDMNGCFEPYFTSNKKKFSHVTYERTVICIAEDMKDVEDSSFDIVVSTYVLCSVTNVEAALKEVRRVLKPNGHYLFLEHVAFPKNTLSFITQNMVNPIWTLYINGCCVNRDNAPKIERAGFSKVTYETVYPSSMLFFLRPQLMGIATK